MFMKSIKSILIEGVKIESISTGFETFDSKLKIEKSNLYILGALPGIGKTSFALNILNLVSKKQGNVFLISLEMSNNQIINRLLAIESKLPLEKIQEAKLNEEENQILEKTKKTLEYYHSFIYTPSKILFSELAKNVNDLHSTNKIDLLIIDDLQRISISEKDRNFAANREQEVSKNVRDLKSLARELNIAIIAISQFNRNNNSRPYSAPLLTDLRDSGAIENDSDAVIFLNRPEYFGILQDQSGNSLVGVVEFEIAKNRYGAVGSFRLRFNKENQKFDEIDNFVELIETVNNPDNSNFNHNMDAPF
jgi:replicative DNA helicase